MKNNTLLARVEEEFSSYDCAEDAAIDHLNMAHSHMFEEFEGRDIEDILSDIDKIRIKIEHAKKEK